MHVRAYPFSESFPTLGSRLSALLFLLSPRTKYSSSPSVTASEARPAIPNRFSSVVLFELFTVDVNIPIMDLNGLTRQTDDPLDIVGIPPDTETETQRFQTVSDPESDRKAYLQSDCPHCCNVGRHGVTTHYRTFAYIMNQKKCHSRKNNQVNQPAHHFFYSTFFLFLLFQAFHHLLSGPCQTNSSTDASKVQTY